MSDLAAQHTLLAKILSNVIAKPDNSKFRKIKTGNVIIQKVLSYPGAQEILSTAGFVPLDTGELIQSASDDEARAACQRGLALLGPPPAPPLLYALSASFGGHGGAVRAVCGLSNGGLATGALDSVVRVWAGGSTTADSPATPCVELRGHSSEQLRAQGGVLAVLDSEALGLVSAGREGNICVWGKHAAEPAGQPREPVRVLQGHGASGVTNSQVVSCLSELQSGAIVSGSWDKTARVWEAGTTTSTPVGGGGVAAAAAAAGDAMSDDAGDAASTAGDTAGAAALAALVAAAGGQVAGLVMSHEFAVNGVASLPGNVVATACGDGGVRLFDGATGNPLPSGGVCQGTGGLPLRALCTVPGYDGGGVGLAAVSNDGYLRVWRQRDGWRAVHRSVFCGGADGVADGYLYAVAASCPPRTPPGGGGGAETGASLPSSASWRRELYTGGEDGVVTVWSHELAPLQRIAFPSDVFGLAFLSCFDSGGGAAGGGLVLKGGDVAVACGDGSAYVLSLHASTSTPGELGAAASFTVKVGDTRAAVAAALTRAPPPAVLNGPPPANAGMASAPSSSSPPPAAQQQSGSSTGGAPTLELAGAFDFNFPVELSAGSRLVISWNRGDDPNTVATQFLAQNGLPSDQVPAIVDFMQQAQSTQAQPQQPPSTTTTVTQLGEEAKAGMVQQVMALGFAEEQATQALDATGWASVEAAIAALFGE